MGGGDEGSGRGGVRAGLSEADPSKPCLYICRGVFPRLFLYVSDGGLPRRRVRICALESRSPAMARTLEAKSSVPVPR